MMPVFSEVHYKTWAAYLRLVGKGSLLAGFLKWVRGWFYRGFALGNIVYFSPWAPLKLRVHEAGHTPAFGSQFYPIKAAATPDGGLDHEPLSTFDIMLPGKFSFLRFRDTRGLKEAYLRWHAEGRVIVER